MTKKKTMPRRGQPAGSRTVREEIEHLKAEGDLLEHEGGTRFYHRHLSPRAKQKRKVRRRMQRQGRRRSRS